MGENYPKICKKSTKKNTDEMKSVRATLHSLIWPQFDLEKFKIILEEHPKEASRRFGGCLETLLHR